jgi:hypothetical protein
MVPKWVRVVTVAAVSVVAAVAAIVSYVHMRELADQAGEQWRAHIIPLSADGLLVAASMVMLVRRRAGERAGLLAWVGLLLGLAASLGANLAVADWSSPVSIAVSGWPPLALAVSFELLIMVTRRSETVPVTVGELVRQTGPTADDPQTGPDQTTQTDADQTAGPGADHTDRSEGGPGPDVRRTSLDRTDEELLTEIRAMADRTGKRPSGRAVRTALGVGPDRAKRLLEEFDRTGPRRAA